MSCTFSWESSTTISRATATEIQLLTRPFEVTFGSFSVISKPKLHSHFPENFDSTSSTHRQDFQHEEFSKNFQHDPPFSGKFLTRCRARFPGKVPLQFQEQKEWLLIIRFQDHPTKFGETATETLSEIRGTLPFQWAAWLLVVRFQDHGKIWGNSDRDPVRNTGNAAIFEEREKGRRSRPIEFFSAPSTVPKNVYLPALPIVADRWRQWRPWQKEELKVHSAAGILWATQLLPYAQTIVAYLETIQKKVRFDTSSDIDLSRGGVYDPDAVDDLISWLKGNRRHNVVMHQLADQVGNLNPGEYITPKLMFPSHTLPGGSWHSFILGKLWGAIRGLGEIFSSIFGLLIVGRLVWYVVKVLMNCSYIHSVHSCSAKLTRSFCTEVFFTRNYRG